MPIIQHFSHSNQGEWENIFQFPVIFGVSDKFAAAFFMDAHDQNNDRM
jgi:hypothetical protein